MRAPGGNISGDGAVINHHTLSLTNSEGCKEKKNGSAEDMKDFISHKIEQQHWQALSLP